MAEGVEEQKVAGGEEADGGDGPAHDALIDAAAEVGADVTADAGEQRRRRNKGPAAGDGIEYAREKKRRQQATQSAARGPEVRAYPLQRAGAGLPRKILRWDCAPAAAQAAPEGSSGVAARSWRV